LKQFDYKRLINDMSTKRQKTDPSVIAARVGTFLDSEKRQAAPDRVMERSELTCDMCGLKTTALRDHNKGKVCWSCKASTVKD
jgi:hypothetical protein